jgi:glycosyltransferase involved in cell wall biosynthesis
VAPREAPGPRQEGRRDDDRSGRILVKVLHVSFSLPPAPLGGTEVHVRGLCASLRSSGVESVVAAPAPTPGTETIDGIRTHRFAMSDVPADLTELYGAGDATATAAFAALLDRERPDVVHQHAVTPACSADVLLLARARGLATVLTYHTPTTTCQRGTLLRWGSEVCSGDLSAEPCAACTLHALGVPRPFARAVAATPRSIGRLIGGARLAGGVWTALRMSALLDVHHARTAALLAAADRVIAPAPWVRDLLRRNGVPDDRLVLIRQGVEAAVPRAARPRRPGEPLRLVHLGRLDPAKGTALLIEAVRAITEAPLTLDVFGIAQDAEARGRRAALEAMARADGRIHLRPAIPPGGVHARLGDYHAVVVPSQGLETGPLVVLEAFRAGVPVIGSNLGGIRDLVRPDIDGWLVEPFGSVDAWSRILTRAAADEPAVERLRANVRPPRSMADVARETRATYEAALAARERTAAAIS